MSETARFAVFSSVLFAAAVVAGILVTIKNPGFGQEILALFRDAILGQVLDSSAPLLAVTLFFNNLQACVVMFFGGASFGLLTAFVIVSNGVIIGSIVELVRQQEGILYIVAALAPHGIFEIPAFIISGTLGFLLARALLNEWYRQGDAAAEATRMGRTFLVLVLPLVLLAAFTEAFITPAVIALVA